MHVSQRWYGHLNEIGLLTSVIFILSYLASRFVFSDNQELVDLSVSLVPAVVAACTIAYIFIVYRFEASKSQTLAGLITMILLLLMIGTQVALSGDLQSLYMPFWVAAVMLFGLFGWQPLVILAIITNLYVAMFGHEVSEDAVANVLYFASIQIPFITSWLLWHGTNKITIDTNQYSPKKIANPDRKADIIVDSITEGVIAINHNQQVQLINPAASTITNWEEEEAVGLNYLSIMRLIDPDTEQMMTEGQDPIANVFSSGEAHKVVGTIDLVTKLDRRTPVNLNISPIKNPQSGVVESVVAVFSDASRDSLMERQRAEFISTASHEMRTPVAAIEGYLALVMNEKVAKIDENARKYLTKAQDSTKHLGTLLKDLLTAAKSEDGRITNHPEVINVGEFLQGLADDFSFTAQEKGLKLVTAFTSDDGLNIEVNTKRKIAPLYYVNADPERLREVIVNLFDNAIKYTKEGSITLDVAGSNEEVTISITDTGIGIAPEDRSHLFEKFYRVDSTDTREIGGTGLGLFICRQIVEMQGGRIWVKSQINEGSTFFVALPRVSTEKASLMQKASDAEVQATG